MEKKEWFRLFGFGRSKRYTPKDHMVYKVTTDVINYTTRVLNEYGNIIPSSHEGLVYWAGHQNGEEILISAVIAPETESSGGRVTVPTKSNFYVVKELSNNRLVHLGQVHSHPSTWVDHSLGDNEWASYKREGLLSLVVPNYGYEGILPIQKCGVHRYDNHSFIRLSKNYLKRHFQIVNQDSIFMDLRNKNDNRWKHRNGIA